MKFGSSMISPMSSGRVWNSVGVRRSVIENSCTGVKHPSILRGGAGGHSENRLLQGAPSLVLDVCRMTVWNERFE